MEKIFACVFCKVRFIVGLDDDPDLDDDDKKHDAKWIEKANKCPVCGKEVVKN